MDSRARRAALVLLALAAPRCDGKPTPPAPQDPRGQTRVPDVTAGQRTFADVTIDQRPPETVYDDEALLAVVYATASRDLPFPESIKTLPPRVSRVRVAVRALHDHLLGVVEAPEDMKS